MTRTTPNVFDLLDQIRLRPSMYVGDEGALHDIERMLWGHFAALDAPGIIEPVPRMSMHFVPGCTS